LTSVRRIIHFSRSWHNDSAPEGDTSKITAELARKVARPGSEGYLSASQTTKQVVR